MQSNEFHTTAKNATRTVIISPPFEIYNVAINTTNPNPGYANRK